MSKLLLPFALSLTLLGGFTSAVRADDDDWEDYQEDREEYFEDLREAQEAHEDWREQQEERADDRRHFYRHNYSPRQIVQRQWYSQQPSYGYGYGGFGGYGYGGYSGIRVQSFYRPPVYGYQGYGVGFGPSGPAYVPYGGFYIAPRYCH